MRGSWGAPLTVFTRSQQCPSYTARSADATTSQWFIAMADRSVPRLAQGGTEQSHWATFTGSSNLSPDHLLKGGHCCCSRCPSHEIVCGTGSAGSAQTGTSQKWSEQERSVPGWRAACWASKLTDKIKVASTEKGTAALGFNSALRGTLVPTKWNSRSIFRPISLQSGGNSIFSMR